MGGMVGIINMIKWRDSDKKKLKDLVENFNRKVERVGKNQPKQIKYKDLVSNIRERSDYNRIYNKYSRYLKKGAEKFNEKYGATQWEVNEFNIAKSQINKAKKKERDKLKPKTYIGTSGDNDDRYKPITRTAENIQNFDRYLKHLEKQQSSAYYDRLNKLYALNYRTALIDQFGDSETTRKIFDIMAKVGNNVVAQTLDSSPFIQIEFVYDENQDLEIRERLILEEWENIQNEYGSV